MIGAKICTYYDGDYRWIWCGLSMGPLRAAMMDRMFFDKRERRCRCGMRERNLKVQKNTGAVADAVPFIPWPWPGFPPDGFPLIANERCKR